MLNRINLITDSRIKRQKESAFGVIAKFDSRINFWGDLVWESGATSNRCTYQWFERNLVDSVRAIYHSTSIKMHSTSCSKSNRALNELFQVEESTRQLHQIGRSDWLGLKLACQALGGYWQGLVPRVPHLLDSPERNRGPTMSWPTRPEAMDQEAHNRGGFENNYRSNLINRTSKDIVWVKYNDNWPDLICKPYPLAYKGGVQGVLTQAIIIQLMHTGRRVFILTEAQTYLNPYVPCVPLFSMSVSTPTLKSSHKPQRVASGYLQALCAPYVRHMLAL
jgi:hypothetical protein